jgi:hypothetical protein
MRADCVPNLVWNRDDEEEKGRTHISVSSAMRKDEEGTKKGDPDLIGKIEERGRRTPKEDTDGGDNRGDARTRTLSGRSRRPGTRTVSGRSRRRMTRIVSGRSRRGEGGHRWRTPMEEIM